MSLVLDTSILIDLERRDEKTLQKLESLSDAHLGPGNITFMNYFEFLHGLRRKRPKNRNRSLAFLEVFHFLQPTEKTARILSRLKNKYEKQGKSIPLTDLLIASQVAENSMILVTKDKHFKGVDEIDKVFL